MAQLQPKEQHSLDSGQEQGFITFYKNLDTKPPTTVRIFDRVDYFTTHGEDASLVAKELFHTNSVIKQYGSGSNQLSYVNLSKLNFESFIRDLLLVKQYRVEVFKQKTTGKNDWEEVYKASPGNLVQFEEILFGSGSHPPAGSGILSIKFSEIGGKKTIGAAFVDVSEQKFLLSQFIDNDSFTNLEAMIVQLNAKECLIPSGDLGHSEEKLKKVFSRNRLLITERKRSEFNNENAAQDISHFIRGNEGNTTVLAAKPEMKMENAVSALVASIRYLELLSDESNKNQFVLSKYERSGFMHLDGAVLSALHVEPVVDSKRGNTKEKNLFTLLDKCGTAQGKRLLTQWIRQPLMDINKIEERQNMIEAFLKSVSIRQRLSEEYIKQIPDLNMLSRKLGRKKINLQDCYKLYHCVKQLPSLCELLATYEGPYETTINAMFIVPLHEVIKDIDKFQEMIELTVDLNQAARGEYVIKPDFDECLTELRQQMDELEEQIQIQFKKIAKDLNLEPSKTIKLESNNQLGYFLRVTLKEEKSLRNNKQYRMIDTNKAGVRFRNSALQSLNEQHLAAKESYSTQQKNVSDEIISIASGYIDVAYELTSILATLDCIISLSTVAATAPVPYCRPKLFPPNHGVIDLKACRHPCLEQQDDISFIPNDCKLSDDSGTFHIITGPNMGGKSTYMRSVATAVLMAQIGSFVACEEATITIVDSILARVGAGDCQMKGVSTFMTEMLETSTILKSSTKNSLIIIDELGRGTSTYDGFGLAWAISEYILNEIGPFCLFATHFHELTALAQVHPKVKNYHVLATTVNGVITLLYQVLPGACDRSFGINVAELANFPPEVIQYAKRKANELEDIYDEDSSEDAIAKRKKWKMEEEEIIDTYLKRVKALDLDSLTDDQINEEIQNMKDELNQTDNPYIKRLFIV